MTHTFISYVREDAALANYIADVLRANGVEPWLDTERIELGQRWKDELRNAIQNGDRFVALFSQARAERDRSVAHEELLIAIEELRQRPRERAWYLPIRIDNSPMPSNPIGGGETLNDVHYADVADRGWGTVLTDLLRAHGVDQPLLEIGTPLAPGFGESADIVGGRMTMRNFQPAGQMAAYEGSVFQITSGFCGRNSNRSIFARFRTFAPNEALQAANEKLGFVNVDALSNSNEISQNSGNPTCFTSSKTHQIPSGERLSLPGLPNVSLPFAMGVTTSFVARVSLQGETLQGTFEAHWQIDLPNQKIEMTGSGDVEIYVRRRIAPPMNP
jgi:TIR domain